MGLAVLILFIACGIYLQHRAVVQCEKFMLLANRSFKYFCSDQLPFLQFFQSPKQPQYKSRRLSAAASPIKGCSSACMPG
jgi:hypothetical protein